MDLEWGDIDLKLIFVVENPNKFQKTKVWKEKSVEDGRNELALANAPMWMDGALKWLSFLSMCHPRLTFLFALSQP